jgi:hypothetical protein
MPVKIRRRKLQTLPLNASHAGRSNPRNWPGSRAAAAAAFAQKKSDFSSSLPFFVSDDFDFSGGHQKTTPSWDADLNLRLHQLECFLGGNNNHGDAIDAETVVDDAIKSPSSAAVLLYNSDSTTTAFDLLESQNTSLKIKPFRCETCRACFHKARELTAHRQEAHPEQHNAVIVDPVAGAITDAATDDQPAPVIATTNPITVSMVRPYACPLCDSRFNSCGARNAHRRKVHQRDHLCTDCDVAFGSAQKLARHLKTHVGVKEFRCETCGKEFSIERNLGLHQKLHLGQKDYACGVCGRTYYTKSGLQAHQRQVHTEDANGFPCGDCEARCMTKFELALHRKAHRGANSEKCGVCGAGFGNQTELKQHRIACHSNRPFACPKCPHRSKTKEKLERHMACHSTRDAHRCQHCGKTFVFKNSLKKHTEKRRCQVLKQKIAQQTRRPPTPILQPPIS